MISKIVEDYRRECKDYVPMVYGHFLNDLDEEELRALVVHFTNRLSVVKSRFTDKLISDQK